MVSASGGDTAEITLSAVAVAVPHAGCAEQPRDDAVILKGHPGQAVTFRPAYGDFPVTKVPAGER